MLEVDVLAFTISCPGTISPNPQASLLTCAVRKSRCSSSDEPAWVLAPSADAAICPTSSRLERKQSASWLSTTQRDGLPPNMHTKPKPMDVDVAAYGAFVTDESKTPKGLPGTGTARAQESSGAIKEKVKSSSSVTAYRPCSTPGAASTRRREHSGASSVALCR
jgi:hypothetical protein